MFLVHIFFEVKKRNIVQENPSSYNTLHDKKLPFDENLLKS